MSQPTVRLDKIAQQSYAPLLGSRGNLVARVGDKPERRLFLSQLFHDFTFEHSDGNPRQP